MAAPTGLAHTMRVASALHNQAGSALVASGASRLSRRQDSWNPVTLIPRSHPRSGANARATSMLATISNAGPCPRPSNAGAVLVQSRDNLNPGVPIGAVPSRLSACSSRRQLPHDGIERGLALEADARPIG